MGTVQGRLQRTVHPARDLGQSHQTGTLPRHGKQGLQRMVPGVEPVRSTIPHGRPIKDIRLSEESETGDTQQTHVGISATNHPSRTGREG